MRILAITNSRIPSLTANSIQAMKVCQALMQTGHAVRIIAPREAKPVPPESLVAHYGLRTTPDLEWLPSCRPLKRLDFVSRAQMAASKFQANLIYTWLLQSAVLALRNSYPVVLEMHADVSGRLGPWWLRQFWKTPGRKRMTVTTHALRKALERLGGFQFPDHEVLLAPNGVDLERYVDLPSPREARQLLNIDENLTIGFTGHVYPGRGADLLFTLAQRMHEINFLWVGGTPDSIAYWRSKLEAANLRNIIMTGFVVNSRLPLYQAASEVLLLPYERSISASSGQDIGEVINPMKMFEYMAAGRAILSADLPAIREVLNEENAVFCEPGNVRAWESNLRELLLDETRRLSLGAQARQDVEGYTWVARAGRILEGFGT
jgi:glycosyltransferase involved in cell wall biosynthesis